MGNLTRVLFAAVASGLACGSRSQLFVSRDATVEAPTCETCTPDRGDVADAGEDDQDAAVDETSDVVDAPEEPVCCSASTGCSAQGCGCEASDGCCAGSCVNGACSMPFCESWSSPGQACLGPGQYCACLLLGGSRPAPFDITGCAAPSRPVCVSTPTECLPGGCAGPSTCACLLARMPPDASPCPQGAPTGCSVSGWNVILDCQLGERLADGGR